jgi:transcriptional regulator with XRE-family HTH domain
MTFADRIKILRILNGFTQQTLADYAKISRASVMLWEKGKLPTRRNTLALSALFEVSTEYLLEGIHPPTYALWKPIAPGHPKHLHNLAIDMEHGIPYLFSELRIVFSAKGQIDSGNFFWICGNAPDSDEWQLNYLLIYDKSLDKLVSRAIRSSVTSIVDLGEPLFYGMGMGALVGAIAESLGNIYGHHPDCTCLYERLGGLEGEGDDDFTLEGLLLRFGLKIQENKDLTDDDLEILARYLATEVAKHSGLSDIKYSASRLIQKSIKHLQSSWNG